MLSRSNIFFVRFFAGGTSFGIIDGTSDTGSLFSEELRDGLGIVNVDLADLLKKKR